MKAWYLFGFGFLVAAGFWPAALDAGFAIRWVVMAVGAPLYFVLFGGEGDKWEPTDLPALLFLLVLGVVGFTAQWSPDAWTACEELLHLAIAAGVVFVGLSGADLRPAWRGLAAGVGVSAVIAAAQLAGWEGIAQAATPGGLFVNRNVLSEAGMVALVATAAGRDWRWTIAPLACVVMGHSVAVFGALGATFAAWLLLRGRVRMAWAILIALAAALVACFVIGAPTALVRMGFWRDAIAGLTWTGHGLGGFMTAFGFAEFAHNEPLHYAYELGLFALAPAAALFYIWQERSYEPEYLVLTSVLAVSLLAFPFHMPVTLFAAGLAAGALAGRRFGVRPRSADAGKAPHRSLEH